MTNLVYDAGGHALLLIHDSSESVQICQRVLKELALEIRETLGGTLRFDYDITEPLLEHCFRPKEFAQIYRLVESNRANARYRFPDSRLCTASTWSDEGWVDTSAVSLKIDRQPFLDQLQNLGQALGNANYLTLDDGEINSLWIETIFGIRVSLHEQAPASGLVYSLQCAEETFEMPLYLTGTHIPKAKPEDIQRLEGSGAAPPDDDLPAQGETLNFESLARLASDDQGQPVPHAMLGVLKADVDHLGSLISYGFNSQKDNVESSNGATLGRLAAFSRTLDQFFKGFLVEQIRIQYPKLYTVFLGGDDLCLIGPWYDLFRFTRQLHIWFEQMTCHNPNITFSAGLIFSKPTTPVAQLADVAEEALEHAKHAGRDRIAYGSVVLSWEQFEKAWELHRLLLDNVAPSNEPNRKSFTPSLVYRLLTYAKQAMKLEAKQMQQHASQPSYSEMKWRAQMSYDLKRNVPRSR